VFNYINWNISSVEIQIEYNKMFKFNFTVTTKDDSSDSTGNFNKKFKKIDSIENEHDDIELETVDHPFGELEFKFNELEDEDFKFRRLKLRNDDNDVDVTNSTSVKVEETSETKEGTKVEETPETKQVEEDEEEQSDNESEKEYTGEHYIDFFDSSQVEMKENEYLENVNKTHDLVAGKYEGFTIVFI
jgi:hypothetical protein